MTGGTYNNLSNNTWLFDRLQDERQHPRDKEDDADLDDE